MKIIQHTADIQLLKDILRRENMYASVAYDDSPPLEECKLEGVWFVLCEGDAVAGLISLTHLNNVTWIPHIYIFEEHRGAGSEQWGILAAEFMRENCGAKKFLAITPWVSAKRYAERMGFRYVTTLSRSIQKDGKMLKQYILEME